MPNITVIYGEKERTVAAPLGSVIGDAIAKTELPLEQPCAGRGTCGKCKILAEEGLAPPDEIEFKNLTPGELAVGNRLACRARISGDVTVTLAPIVVYSNKIFRASSKYKRGDRPLGLAIDLGSTTVAALLTDLETGEVYAGGAGLNQQTVYGSDVISRLAAATNSAEDAERLRLAFTMEQTRIQRKSDGTISVAGVRFELPSRFRTLGRVTVRYRRWDLSSAWMIDPRTKVVLAKLRPLDKAANANRRRRSLAPLPDEPEASPSAGSGDSMPPLMRKLLADYAATGLPPAYLPKDELPAAPDQEDDDA